MLRIYSSSVPTNISTIEAAITLDSHRRKRFIGCNSTAIQSINFTNSSSSQTWSDSPASIAGDSFDEQKSLSSEKSKTLFFLALFAS